MKLSTYSTAGIRVSFLVKFLTTGTAFPLRFGHFVTVSMGLL